MSHSRHSVREPLETARHDRRPVVVWGVGMLCVLLGVILSGFEAVASDDVGHREIYGIIGLFGIGILLIIIGLVWSFRRKP